ncbi:AbrB/MazE/SpoVT family DNA-binding domain-containing protein [Gordonia pseudamarae]|jgi:AbrB family looped-hinge helix DNA binding protein|uniref:AbrB/MazE/SpoVT family DNA-binding domain-containing protein n=1 Tax=Gordonia pseudamarae TaxID=2831662 RepID=A0ABX6IN23_9ACTN|nr:MULTISPECIES: AbrB/MazE/SpoVT family DNA-binding domain-containing protein [Gordonia]MBD0022240.1 AbrB/MazE/SpoVT family DNA-binding domain-containing protein [Gordonia sp. (in: high G+C Gram-positive bacteria)]QHN28251.1 AbrB/MazE/SpoVT family DNA-binding domain-containing protein [Gordonia pseudamarae]QHN37111.1 AbrB/MazE/SpoVT family DNA-binding domain-containing protein [Gordonia pseudamarae]
MRTTIDRSGRIVVPKELRARIGLVPGEIEIRVSGSSLVIEPVAGDDLVAKDGLLVLPDGGPELSADDIRELRLGDQR